jgi:hypothetical protein
MSSINSVSNSGNAFPTAPTKPNQQTKADFKALSEALKANDLAAAQAAFAALKKDDPNLAKKLSEQESAKSNPLNDLAAALDKGDLSAAQTALASLKKGHHGHAHRPASIADSNGSVSSMAADIMGTSTTGTVIDVKV